MASLGLLLLVQTSSEKKIRKREGINRRRKESRKERGTGEVMAWSGFRRRGVADSDLRRGHEAAGLRGSCTDGSERGT